MFFNRSSERPTARRSGSPDGFESAAHSHETWHEFACGRSAIELIDRLDEKLSRSLSDFGESHWKWIFSGFPDGLCLTDHAGILLHTNAAFDALLDVDESDRQKPLDELLEIRFADRANDVSRRLSQGQSSFSVQLRQNEKTSDGVLRLNCTRLQNDEGKDEGLLWCLRDITQLKLAEEMRNEFVATATHELRTPLTNLQGYAELLTLEKDIDVEQQREFSNIIRSEAGRLGRLIDELLNISQMDGGGLTIAQHELDLERLLQEIVDSAQSDFALKQQNFEFVPPAKYPKVTGDREKLASAVVNLLGNAAKYTPDGGNVKFEVEVGDDWIHLHVEDTGFGIAESELENVFARFFRSDDERVQDQTGNGLGLAFTQEVARLHGGRVSVHSELDKGSRFTFMLPVA